MEVNEKREITKDLIEDKHEHVPYKSALKTLISYLLYEKKAFVLGVIFSFINSLFYVLGSFLAGFIVTKYISPAVEASDHAKAFDAVGFSITLSCLALSFITYAIFRYLENSHYVKVAYNSGSRLRNEIIAKFHKLPLSFYDKNKTGNLISSIIVDVNNISNSMFQVLTQVTGGIFSMTLAIVILSLLSLSLTAIIVPLSLVLFGLVMLLMKKSQPHFIKVQNAFGELNAFVEEMLVNTKVTNSFDQQAYTFSKLEKITLNIRDSAYIGDTIAKSFDTLYGIISNIVIVAITGIAATFTLFNLPLVGIPGIGINENGRATAGFVITYISICWSYIGPFQQILNSTFSLQIGVASSSRLFKLTKIKTPDTSQETIELKQVNGHIVFNDVYFKYNPKSLNHQLKSASFEAKPGEVVAIVGPTGAGKTTIISLLSKYYDYEKGSITIDGNELRNIKTKQLRDNMTIVLQDSFLFNESIIDNLKIANPHATDEEIMHAAKLTQAHHFIMNMPDGYNTMIENNGSNLSQGQKQLLSITRAILSNRSILILDEATSNIDSSTEKIVQEAMLHLMKNKTSFVIAHRLSTIKNADQIIVVDDGFIIEKGSHKQLLDQQGFYYDLYTSQFKQ
ncbi:ABC transporter ATP-binding protein [Mycoplasma corogypsi]|uniref:ABC transporter ATP-binding protein n=1 Tax=Mycoplasma corogypsi TaxID=2106 RepID=UPI003872DC92